MVNYVRIYIVWANRLHRYLQSLSTQIRLQPSTPTPHSTPLTFPTPRGPPPPPHVPAPPPLPALPPPLPLEPLPPWIPAPVGIEHCIQARFGHSGH